MDEGSRRKEKKTQIEEDRKIHAKDRATQKTMRRHKPTTLVGRQTIKSAIMESCYYRTTKCFL